MGSTRTSWGIPMAFWRDQMPTDMFLRPAPTGTSTRAASDTFAAYFEDRGLEPGDLDPIPIAVFLDHADWFAEQKALDVDQRLVTALDQAGGALRRDDGRRLHHHRRQGPGGARASRTSSTSRVVRRRAGRRRSHTSERSPSTTSPAPGSR